MKYFSNKSLIFLSRATLALFLALYTNASDAKEAAKTDPKKTLSELLKSPDLDPTHNLPPHVKMQKDFADALNQMNQSQKTEMTITPERGYVVNPDDVKKFAKNHPGVKPPSGSIIKKPESPIPPAEKPTKEEKKPQTGGGLFSGGIFTSPDSLKLPNIKEKIGTPNGK